jgi:hypothetical protein
LDKVKAAVQLDARNFLPVIAVVMVTCTLLLAA